MTDTPRVTVPVEPEGVSPVYTAAYDSIRKGAPGLSDATCAAIARSINMKVSLSAAPALEGGAVEGLREALIQADLNIRSLPGTDQSDVEFIRAALATREEAPAPCKSCNGSGMDAGSRFNRCPDCFEETSAEAGETIEARFPELNDDLIRMASTGSTGSLIEWGAFIERLKSALRAQPPAREDAQPVAWRMVGSEGGLIGMRSEPYHSGFERMMKADVGCVVQPLYIHPAPDALREAAKKLAFMARTSGGTPGPDRDLMSACDAVEAALQAEQKGGA